MTIPLESRAHVIFTYALVPNTKKNLCIKKLYYKGIKIKISPKYINEVAEMLAKSTNLKKTIDNSGFKSFNVFTENRDEALNFSYNDVFEAARRLELQFTANMYVESLDEEWMPF